MIDQTIFEPKQLLLQPLQRVGDKADKEEIMAVERRSKTLTLQKRSLMQKLLMGEWRAAV